MKTIEEAAQQVVRSYTNDYGTTYDEDEIEIFKAGVEFAQRWYSLSSKPDNITYTTVSENNGNKHLHGIKYILKGYYNDNKENIGYEVGEWLPCSACYYFVTKRNFTATHWRPIELK